MSVVRVLILLPATGHEIDAAILFVHVLNPPHCPITGGYLILELRGCLAEEIQMIPAVTLRRAKNLVAGIEEAELGEPGVHIFIRVLTDHGFLLASLGLDYPKLDRLITAFCPVVTQALAVWKPHEPGPALEGNLQRGGLNLNTFS